MPMTFIQMTTHWEAEEAHSVIEFLDQLRDALWQRHGEGITQMQRESSTVHNDRQHDLPFDDPLDF